MEDSDYPISPPDSADAPPAPAKNPRVRTEQTRLLYTGVRSSIPASAFVACLMAYVLAEVVNVAWIVTWLGIFLLVTAFRALTAVRYFRDNPSADETTPWLNAFLAGTWSAGVVWGGGAWLLYPADAVEYQAFLGVLVAGLAAGAVTSLSPSLRAVMGFLLLSLTPLMLRYLGSDSGLILTLGILIIVFLITISISAKRINDNVVENTKLQLESAAREQALRESEERYRSLFQRNKAVELLIDPASRRIVDANDAATEYYGFPPDELRGMAMSRLCADPLDQIEEQLEDALSNRRNYFFASHRRATSEQRDVEIYSGSIVWEGRMLLYAIVHDITDRLRAELGLSRFKTTLDQTLDCVFMFDAEAMKFFYVNQGAIDQVGYSRAELLNMTPLDIKPDFNLEKFQSLIGPILRGEETVHRFETRHQHKDGHLIPVEIALQYVAPPGESGRFVAIVRDITERKQSEQAMITARREAEQASRAKSEFMATMSHEIRTPMNAVLGMTELLADSPLNAEQREFTDTIHQSGKALLAIIGDILDYSKIEAGRLELEPIAFDLEQSILEVGQLLASRAHEKGLELVLDYDPDCPRHLIGDAGRIRQIIVNLAGNAVKFTHEGHVQIKVHGATGDDGLANLRIEVRDTGIGIRPDAKGKLFDSFTQADGSTTRKYGGTGLGLAISKQLVDLMGGNIGVDSIEGEGSSFHVEFSLPRSGAGGPLDSIDLHGIAALVVDATELNRSVIRRQLEAAGMQVATVEDSASAMTRLRNAAQRGQPFRVALIDNDVPDTGGMILAAGVRDDESLADLRLVLMTASGRRGDGRQCRDSGFSGYLTKPASGKLLVATLSQVLALTTDGGKPTELVTRHSISEAQNHPHALPPFKPAHLLLAEDVPANRKVAVSMLRRMGLEVDLAENGRIALERCAGHDYDLILMDCQMPEMDGLEATAALRQREAAEHRHTPVVALTANTSETDRKKCLDAGMDGFLAKPFEMRELHQTLAKWLALQAEILPIASQPADTEAPVQEPLDTCAVERLKDAMGEDFVEFIPAYIESVQQILAALPDTLEQQDFAAIERHGHSLKSASQNIGAHGLVRLGKIMEKQGRNRCLIDAKTQVRSMEREFVRVREALEEVG